MSDPSEDSAPIEISSLIDDNYQIKCIAIKPDSVHLQNKSHYDLCNEK